jgi:hypothetical protein
MITFANELWPHERLHREAKALSGDCLHALGQTSCTAKHSEPPCKKSGGDTCNLNADHTGPHYCPTCNASFW